MIESRDLLTWSQMRARLEEARSVPLELTASRWAGRCVAQAPSTKWVDRQSQLRKVAGVELRMRSVGKCQTGIEKESRKIDRSVVKRV